MNFKAIAAATLFCMSTSAASAAPVTYNFDGAFSSTALGNVNFDFTVSFDDALSVTDTDNGLTVNSLTSTIVSGDPFTSTTKYSFDASTNIIRFGAGDFARDFLQDATTDFFVAYDFDDGASGVGGRNGDTSSSGSIISLEVTEVAPVPLPAAGWMLLAGIGGLGVMARRRKA
jgi:hypothetical protein